MSSSGSSSREKLMGLPVRSYLDETVVPVMMQALAAVARDRPDDPVDFVAHYLLKHNPRRVAEAARSANYGFGGSGTTGQ